jgi:hypothetical protein
VNIYVTSPFVFVATVRLEEEAKNLYREEIVVVAITPFTVEVSIPDEAFNVLLLIILVLVAIPFTDEVKVLIAELRALVFMKEAVVVETLPFTDEVRVRELVEVETVSKLTVPDCITEARLVVVETPLTVEVRRVPVAKRLLEEITDEVATIPLIEVVRVLPLRV